MRFLHLADVHLDTPFAGRSPVVRARLRAASREALERAFSVALQEQVHAVLVAGDLFDGARLSFETERFLLGQLRRLDEAGIPLIYATGNHDPGREGGRSAQLEWPACVTVVSDAATRRIAVRDRDAVVVGHVTAAGHAGSRETRDLAAGFPVPPGQRPEVALLHARVVGSRDEEAHEPYAPSALSTLQRAGYHYWALGHIHLRQALSEDPAIHYPGNLQGRTHAEAGPRGGLLVELDERGRAEVAFLPLSPVRWETIVVDGLDRIATLDGLVRRVEARWQAERAADSTSGSEWMVRVVLRGGTPLHAELSRDENVSPLTGELTERLGALEVEVRSEAVHPVVDLAEHRDRADVLGEALRRLALLAGGAGVPPELGEELAGPEYGVTGLESYVAELLDGADSELLARVLDPHAVEP